MTEVFLIRHADAVYDSAIRDAHRPLSFRGLRQADALVEHVKSLGIEEIHTSPYQRCVHTVAPLAESLGLHLNVELDLREREFTGAHIQDWAGIWKTAWMDPDFAFDDGESGRRAQVRMYEAVMRVVTGSKAGRLAISSHGNVIALLLQKISSSFTFEHACSIRNPDVFRIVFDGASLSWDQEFDVAGLKSFATDFQTRTTDQTAAPRSESR
jgi:2,3-bisphosphoglycerate-dependent phosphoglycerate mutase